MKTERTVLQICEAIPSHPAARTANRSLLKSQNARPADALNGAAGLNAKESDYAIS
ncbi:hypothetical protein M2375_000041 [Comamonas sp. BIGb0152]|nr:hypothetical protein [Comamonas sp. BIGb0152]